MNTDHIKSNNNNDDADREQTTSLYDYLKSIPQHVLPQHSLSKLMHAITRSRNPALKNFLINKIIKLYNVDMSLAREEQAEAYATFNAFFTRELKPSVRPIADKAEDIACPVDGTVSQSGTIHDGDIFQAKNKKFTVQQLLATSDSICDQFSNGSFATIYLSPRDYHRIHCPLDAKLLEMSHIPGRLFSVNPATTRTVNELFARNERVSAIFETPAGLMAVVMVGAIFVSSIDTVWSGTVVPPYAKSIRHWKYAEDAQRFIANKGDELGRFNMGSTVVLLFQQGKVNLSPILTNGKTVKMGEKIGALNINNAA